MHVMIVGIHENSSGPVNGGCPGVWHLLVVEYINDFVEDLEERIILFTKP